MTMTWFKLHHEVIDDIKIRRFSAQEKWAWVVLLCLASKSNERGTIQADNDDLADYCEFNCTQDWLYYRDKLIAKGMLEINEFGSLTIVHWNERQAKKPSDDPARVKERVTKSRAKKKTQAASQSQEAVTTCIALQPESNATVTPQIRSEEIRRDQKRSENTRLGDIYTPSVENFPNSCQPTQEILISADMTEKKETPPPPPAPLFSENIGLTIAEKPKAKKIAVDLNLFLQVWLQDSPSHWVQHRTIDSRTTKQLINFVKEFGDKSLDIFQKGLLYAQTDTHWCMKPERHLGMSNLLSENLIFKFYERYEDQQRRSQESQPISSSSSQERMARNYAKFADELGIGA